MTETTSQTSDRLQGTLRGERLEDRGFAWLSIGKGQPNYFIHRNQLPPEAWVRGALIEFTPEPPRRGTANQRAGKPRLICLPDKLERAS